MGCLCSKAEPQNRGSELTAVRPNSNKNLASSNRQADVTNILHQSISLKNSKTALSSLVELFKTNNFEAFSLLICPPADELLRRCWIKKRGHLVRTWKKRYCVLDKNDLNYYAQSCEDPPFGKKFKGKLALLGAVCIDRESDDGKTIEVEIYGNLGEKDLFFEVENSDDSQVIFFATFHSI
jgi:hypothetical protein